MDYKCYTNDKDYLDLKCYNRYKERFLKRSNRVIKSQYKEPFENYINELSGDMDKFKDVFKELALYLSDDHVHSHECNNYICCRHMSYLIQEKISSLNNTIFDRNIFNKFQNFANKLTQSIRTNTCKENFDYLTTDVIDNMRILYKLYEYYNEIRRFNVKDEYQKNRICETLALFVKTFNEIKVDLLKDDAFYRKLEGLKELMKSEHTWTTDRTCSSNLNSITLKKNDPPSEIVPSHQTPPQLALKDSLTSEVVQEQKTHLGLQVPSEPEVQSKLDEASRSHNASTSNSVSELRGTLELKDTLRPEGEFKSPLSTELNGRLKNVEMGNILQEREPVEIYTHQSLYTHYTPEYRHRDERAEEVLIENLQTSPIDHEGVLETMKNALSSIVKDVEPGPVLGVSGGMGALFLLFKVDFQDMKIIMVEM
ncbi:hypothetical protein, conserved [Plasmodium vivax]|uniref:VIR protein n=1 Tax=Plasmodium vivax TaxID=5855 RepID=A0A1G4EDC9_PLAVI|nr:hypothetical protein, conserved [Plasmodium vivax]